ncbi:MAG: type IV secretion system protein [Pseudomonadota bacterium]
MESLNFIDTFFETLVAFIDSGFGFLQADVAYLTSVLVTIDIVLACLLWALSDDGVIHIHLIRKVLYVGFFALLLNNFPQITTILSETSLGLGLQAGQTQIDPKDLFTPSYMPKLAWDAVQPLLTEIRNLSSGTGLLFNAFAILFLSLALIILLFAFFYVAIQLFVTIIEFKIVSLVAFILIPFALFGRTVFLADRANQVNLVRVSFKVKRPKVE